MKDPMKIFIISSGKYGKRIVNNLAAKLSSQIVGLHEEEEDLPEFIEDLTPYLPDNLPQADLVIAVGLKGDINLIVPEVARNTGAKSIIISINDPTHIPPGLRSEIEQDAGDIKTVFAKPFCTLKPTGDQYIDEFTRYFGKPDLEIDADQLIKRVEVKRDAPCGCTAYVASELESVPAEDAEFVAAEKFHNYPCLASMGKDPELNDAILHVAGYQVREAVKRALGFTCRSALVDTEECQGGEDCEHLCRDVCPQVKAGEPTITTHDDEKAYIDPASCGCCGLCINECPYGCIEIIEEKMSLDR
jgi:NAD-dependent dihydropyrimidine dehydrogenase PreA subunit